MPTATATKRPLGLQNFLRILMFNTLHGFNAYPSGDKEGGLILGILGKRVKNDGSHQYHPIDAEPYIDVDINENECQEEIRLRAELSEGSVHIGDFIGRTYLQVADRKDAKKAIDAALACGYRIQLQTKLEPTYDPFKEKDLKFSIAKSEELALKFLRRHLNPRDWMFDSILKSKKDWYGDERLWQTEEGKQFARDFRQALSEMDREEIEELQLYPPSSGYDYLPEIDYPLYYGENASSNSSSNSSCSANASANTNSNTNTTATTATNTTTIPTIPDNDKKRKAVEIEPPQSQSQSQSDSGEIVECMICLSAYPDTMVLPCGHQVVCRQCSSRLAGSRDARTCVRCRRPITNVLYDGK